jgi:hypothetical protein
VYYVIRCGHQIDAREEDGMIVSALVYTAAAPHSNVLLAFLFVTGVTMIIFGTWLWIFEE